MTINRFDGKYTFLSNFSLTTVYFEDWIYPTVEHAYQAAKTLDLEYRKLFLTGTPGQVKRLGRKVSLRPDWEDTKDSIMRDLLKQKFDYVNHQDLAIQLIQTQDKPLLEGNYWHDNYWGSCTCQTCEHRKFSPGKNMLGKMLMEVRAELNRLLTSKQQ
jgi:ribA/ribD-fused uncharacterized protein